MYPFPIPNIKGLSYLSDYECHKTPTLQPLPVQGLKNPLSGCPGQVKIFAGQVKYFLTCPEKCIRYIGKPKEIQYFVAEVLHRTSRSNFDLSRPAV